MPTLILCLPVTPVGANPAVAGGAVPEYDYVLQRDDQQTVTHGRAVAALLPAAARGTAVVAVVPARVMSWHRVDLPAKVAAGVLSSRADPQRVRAVLGGAMEERLLDDVLSLHFAVFPGADGQAPVWVAVCDRAWLRSALGALETSGYTVSRIVAECEPVDPGDNALVLVSAATEPPQVALCTLAGVTLMPLGQAAVSLIQSCSALEVRAEPAVMGIAESTLGMPVHAQTVQQGLLRVAQSRRNLAQLEFSPSRSGRAMKRFASAWQILLHAPPWRPVRWGLLALLVSQVLALNAVAYRQQVLLAQKRAGMEGVLLQTFPNVPVIVDAPLQMQREVSALAQSRGAGEADVARLLSAVGMAGITHKTLTAIDLNAQGLRLKVSGLTDADAAAVTAAVGAQGWLARVQGDALLLQRKEAN